jgi:hypothetical protein
VLWYIIILYLATTAGGLCHFYSGREEISDGV